MKNKRILFGISGSFCNHAAILQIIKNLSKENDLTFVISENVYTCDTRFFKADEFYKMLASYTNHNIIHDIVGAEKIGPLNAFDLMVIAPATATLISKMRHGIYDHPIALAAKAMRRNKKNVVFGVATNDGLSMSGENIFSLMNFRGFYVIPFRQDEPYLKERSIVSDWNLLEESCEKALDNLQIQPILLGSVR